MPPTTMVIISSRSVNPFPADGGARPNSDRFFMRRDHRGATLLRPFIRRAGVRSATQFTEFREAAGHRAPCVAVSKVRYPKPLEGNPRVTRVPAPSAPDPIESEAP